jgi:hypothetical protein
MHQTGGSPRALLIPSLENDSPHEWCAGAPYGTEPLPFIVAGWFCLIGLFLLLQLGHRRDNQ